MVAHFEVGEHETGKKTSSILNILSINYIWAIRQGMPNMQVDVEV